MAQSYFSPTTSAITAEPEQMMIADTVANAEDVQQAYVEQKDR